MKTRLNLVDKNNTDLSVRRQCSLLSVNRNQLYYNPAPEKSENLRMMEIMDKH